MKILLLFMLIAGCEKSIDVQLKAMTREGKGRALGGAYVRLNGQFLGNTDLNGKLEAILHVKSDEVLHFEIGQDAKDFYVSTFQKTVTAGAASGQVIEIQAPLFVVPKPVPLESQAIQTPSKGAFVVGEEFKVNPWEISSSASLGRGDVVNRVQVSPLPRAQLSDLLVGESELSRENEPLKQKIVEVVQNFVFTFYISINKKNKEGAKLFVLRNGKYAFICESLRSGRCPALLLGEEEGKVLKLLVKQDKIRPTLQVFKPKRYGVLNISLPMRGVQL